MPINTRLQNPDHQWFQDARFGLFIHFGVYSALCDGEWVMEFRRITVHDYKKLQHVFNPQLFDAAKWVALAKKAGARYITFTARHHDGFSNWDTKQSEWNIMNTPYGKDIVRQLADECHKEGIKLMLYYSLSDWSRDDYSYRTGRYGQFTGRTAQGEWSSYIRFMKAQLTELLTNYGEIAGIWFDGELDQLGKGIASHEHMNVDWHTSDIYSLIHALQPKCMIANNHHLPALSGEDFQVFEQDLPGETKSQYSGHQPIDGRLPLETCESINQSWGYSLSDNNYKSTEELIHLIVRAAGYGANLLLNVAPMPTGEIDETSVSRLTETGKWLSLYGETVCGTSAGIIKPQNWGALTQKGDTHYVHILSNREKTLILHFPKKIQSARWLNNESELNWKISFNGDIIINLENTKLTDIDSIIEIQTN
jgi:alpha-L-fucosidase